ncbi:hypothetical protein [Paenibacillus xylanexedens]|uniref:hypothetical protein n=1 Tax=Paenibacillus xylanexedens TaxID=528191 RepID=UPI000F530276|nr:hypothetical protein [Paenibacillus xylanexedens]RPK19990.1 hypothetical protein EDO6_06507 [Paenibacillus xylanexedens]
MEIQYCKCGSPMSAYEVEKFKQCGGCHEKDIADKRAFFLESERLKKLEEERHKKEQEQIRIDRFNAKLKELEGKVISSAVVTEWKDAMGIEPKQVLIECEDGTKVFFTQEECSNGCRGSYDYYQYLEVDMAGEIIN